MAKAKKLPSGQWRCLAFIGTVNGKRKYKSFTAPTKKEAELMAASYVMEQHDLEHKLTFEEALNDYIRSKSSVLSPATIREYTRAKSDFDDIKDIDVHDITQKIVQDHINSFAVEHAPKSVRNNHGLLSSVLKSVRPDFKLNTTLPKKVRPNLTIPKDSDIKKLLKAVEGTEMEIPVLLAAFGPMRRGEICALQMSDIEGNVVHVRHNMVMDKNKNWVLKSPKSYAGDRYITFPDFVIAKIGQISSFDGRVVNLYPAMISDRFPTILKQNNIPHFRFHDLRHYSASIMHALNIPDAYIMQRGGWENDAVLKGIYRHALEDKVKLQNEKANDYFAELCNTKCNTKKKKAQ